MWILTFIESNNYTNILWFVDVVTVVGWLTWMSFYWVWFLMVLLSSLILPAADPDNFAGFKASDGTLLDDGVGEGVIAVLLYGVVVAVDTVVQLLWIECLTDWRAWA